MTLRELKAAKEKCNQLMIERNDSEQTLLDTLKDNDNLRFKLSSLHSQYVEATNTRDRLQLFVDS